MPLASGALGCAVGAAAEDDGFVASASVKPPATQGNGSSVAATARATDDAQAAANHCVDVIGLRQDNDSDILSALSDRAAMLKPRSCRGLHKPFANLDAKKPRRSVDRHWRSKFPIV